MAKRSRFTDYENSYANYKFELTDDGILFMQCHTEGESLVWSWKAHDEMSDAFADIAGDREIKVLIHTGTGENYNANWGLLPNGEPPEQPMYQAMPGDPRDVEARREGLVRTSSHLQRARRRRADDQRGQRPVQYALRGADHGGHRAGLRGRLFPGCLALPARPGPRRRPARDLERAGRAQPRALLPAHGPEAQRPRGQGVGRGQRGAARRTSCWTGLGSTPANWSSGRR